MKKLLLKSILLLCALVASSGSMWAAEGDTHDFSQSISVLLNSGASISSINIAAQSYPVKEVIISYTHNKSLDGDFVTAACSVGDDNWGSEMLTCNTTTTQSFTGSSATGAIAISFTNHRTASSKQGTFQVTNVRLVEGAASTKVATPTFSPVAGAVASGTEVTISCATDGATIYYTTDGTEPSSSSTPYNPSSKPTITAATTIKAIGVKDGLTNSAVATASYTIALPPVVTLDFSSNSNWSFPTSKEEGPETYTNSGYSITLKGSSGNGYYFDTSANNLLLGKKDATLTLPAFGFNVSKIKVYGATGASGSVTFNVYVGDEAVSTSATSSQVDHEFAIAAEKQDVGTIYVIKVTNAYNMRISKIEVYGNGCEAGVVSNAGWATYVTTSDVEYPANTAYVVATASGSGLTLAEVTEVPAETPLLLKGEGAKTAIALDAAPAAPAPNKLKKGTGATINAVDKYVMVKRGGKAVFAHTGDHAATVAVGKAYLDLNGASPAHSFVLDDSETTGINNVNYETISNNRFFDMQGREVVRPTKGLYIVNGKKVVIK